MKPEENTPNTEAEAASSEEQTEDQEGLKIRTGIKAGLTYSISSAAIQTSTYNISPVYASSPVQNVYDPVIVPGLGPVGPGR